MPTNRFDELLREFQEEDAKHGGGGFMVYAVPSQETGGWFNSPAAAYLGTVFRRGLDDTKDTDTWAIFGNFTDGDWETRGQALEAFDTLSRRAGAALSLQVRESLLCRQKAPADYWFAFVWMHDPPLPCPPHPAVWGQPFRAAANAIERGGLITSGNGSRKHHAASAVQLGLIDGAHVERSPEELEYPILEALHVLRFTGVKCRVGDNWQEGFTLTSVPSPILRAWVRVLPQELVKAIDRLRTHGFVESRTNKFSLPFATRSHRLETAGIVQTTTELTIEKPDGEHVTIAHVDLGHSHMILTRAEKHDPAALAPYILQSKDVTHCTLTAKGAKEYEAKGKRDPFAIGKGEALSSNTAYSDQNIPPRARKAGEQYTKTVEAMKEENPTPTDCEVYDTLQKAFEKAGKGADLPSFASWQRNLRDFRRLTGQQKNKPRAGRAQGMLSVVRPDQIEPHNLPTSIQPRSLDE